tara:strand:+ start:259 stop:546 length:288 start_codon:yes stop_codon:yes gene_type:complete
MSKPGQTANLYYLSHFYQSPKRFFSKKGEKKKEKKKIPKKKKKEKHRKVYSLQVERDRGFYIYFKTTELMLFRKSQRVVFLIYFSTHLSLIKSEK